MKGVIILKDTMLKELKNFCKTYALKIVLAAFAIGLVSVAIAFLVLADTLQVKKIYTTYEEAGYVIFATTQDGSLLYVPINDKEAVMEQSSASGESLYLWLETGQTVAITDDVIVTNQVGLYDMLIAVTDAGITKKENDNYVSTVTGLDNVFDLMTQQWQLTEGQAMGSLACYNNKLASSDVTMELITNKDNENVHFKLNLFVDNTGYTIYEGRLLKQNEPDLPKFNVDMYNLNGISTLSKNDNLVKAYVENAINYFYELALFLDVEELSTGGNE